MRMGLKSSFSWPWDKYDDDDDDEEDVKWNKNVAGEEKTQPAMMTFWYLNMMRSLSR